VANAGVQQRLCALNLFIDTMETHTFYSVQKAKKIEIPRTHEGNADPRARRAARTDLLSCE